MRPLVIATLLLLFAPVQAAVYRVETDVLGYEQVVASAHEDTLAAIAERYGVGYRELLDANPHVDPWLPGEGARVRLPTRYVLPPGERDGLVINLAEYRLYYFYDGRVLTYPIGLGREEYRAPLGTWEVIAHIAQPSWTPTEAAHREHAEAGNPLPAIVPPGPDNPLGSFALQLSAPGYFLHGTNKPLGVGQMVSQGCIRLYEPHIESLSEMVANGTQVRVIYEPVKVGRRHGQTYVEIHRGPYENASDDELVQRLMRELGDEMGSEARSEARSEAKLREIVRARSGRPERI